MNRLESDETGNDHLAESEKRQLEDGLRILARIITKAILREQSVLDRSGCKEYRDSAVRPHHIAAPGKPDQPLALSVREAAKLLGLGRASAYEAVRAGQIPSLRFGKRIVVPRAALDRMLSETDTYQSQR
jgi:excisionase family DNA binding protein